MGGFSPGLAGGSVPVGRRGDKFVEADSINELSRYYPDFEITKKPETLDWHFKNKNTGKEFVFDHMELKEKSDEFKALIDTARTVDNPLLVKDIIPELKKATPEEIKEKLKTKKKKDEHFSDGMSLSSQRWAFSQAEDLQRMALQRQMAEQLARQQRGLFGGF